MKLSAWAFLLLGVVVFALPGCSGGAEDSAINEDVVSPGETELSPEAGDTGGAPDNSGTDAMSTSPN